MMGPLIDEASALRVERWVGEAVAAGARVLHRGAPRAGAKLGPIVWQFAPTKQFVPDDFEAFLTLLPDSVEGETLRHVLEVRHDHTDPAHC